MDESGIAAFIQRLFSSLVESFGILGLPATILVLILIMIIQAVIAPIVSEAILSSAGAILKEAFGTVGIYGAIFGGIIGSILGAIASFYIARWFQSQVKSRIVDKYSDQYFEEEMVEQNEVGRVRKLWNRMMNRVAGMLSRFIDDESENFIGFIEERGFLIVLIGRMLVIVPFDAISYAAGFTKIKFKDYIIATTIGTIPRVIFYVLLGAQLATALTENFSLFVVLFVLIAGGIFTLYRVTMRYLQNYNKNKSDVQSLTDV